MRSTIVNTSKEMMAYSDFPPDENLPNFMHNTKVANQSTNQSPNQSIAQVQEYLVDYMNAFKLGEHIRLNTCVESVEQTKDHDVTGQWRVTSDKFGEEIYDAVMVCSGHHADQYWPKFKGGCGVLYI